MLTVAKAGRKDNLTLRAQSKEPRANYIINDVRGSLIGDVPSMRGMSADEINLMLRRILDNHGARRVDE